MDMPGLTNPMRGLILPRDSRSKRVSSYCTSGGNADRWMFEPGEKTGELADRVQSSIDDEIQVAIRACQTLEGD